MRLIDADALKADWKLGDRCKECQQDARKCQYDQIFTRMDICEMIDDAPTATQWIDVNDALPEQHRSIFAPWYGRKEWATAMWLEESDRVLVAIRFSDGTRVVCTGKLHDGEWRTDVNRSLNPVVTHWMPFPRLPKEES